MLPLNQPRLISHDASVAYGKGHCVVDAALFHGRSFRVGWGPNWTFVSINSNTQFGSNNDSKFRENEPITGGAKATNSRDGCSSFFVNIKKFEDENSEV